MLIPGPGTSWFQPCPGLPLACAHRSCRGAGEWYLSTVRSLGEAEAGVGWAGSRSAMTCPCGCSVIQLCIPLQSPFVATVPPYPHKSPTVKVGRRTFQQHKTLRPKCHAEGRRWHLVTLPLFAGGETEAQSGAVTYLRLQSQREAPKEPLVWHPPREPPTWLHPQHPDRHSSAEGTNIRSHLQSHFFQAELFPGWVSPLGKAPGPF